MTVEAQTHVQTMELLGVKKNEGAATVAAASTTTAYTKSFLWPRGSSFSVEYQFTSDGTVDVTIEIESGGVEPTTENAADTDNYGVGNSIEANVAVETTIWKSPSPTVSKYCRFKLTGNGSNAASTVLSKLNLHYVSAD